MTENPARTQRQDRSLAAIVAVSWVVGVILIVIAFARVSDDAMNILVFFTVATVPIILSAVLPFFPLDVSAR